MARSGGAQSRAQGKLGLIQREFGSHVPVEEASTVLRLPGRKISDDSAIKRGRLNVPVLCSL